MLEPDLLKKMIQSTLEQTIPNAIEDSLMKIMPMPDAETKEWATNTAEAFKNICFEDLADGLASAIHTYVSRACVIGQVLTKGSPTIQQANLLTDSSPQTKALMQTPNILALE